MENERDYISQKYHDSNKENEAHYVYEFPCVRHKMSIKRKNCLTNKKTLYNPLTSIADSRFLLDKNSLPRWTRIVISYK